MELAYSKCGGRCFVCEKRRRKIYKRQARRKALPLIVAPLPFLTFSFLLFLLYMHTFMHTHTYVKVYPYKQTYFFMHFCFMWIYTLLLICLLSYNSDIEKKLSLGILNLHKKASSSYKWNLFMEMVP